jgi:TolB-like protein
VSPGPARPVLPLPDKPSIAVMPFQNMSADPEREYSVDGIVDQITTAIAPAAVAVRHRPKFELRL